MSLDLCLIMNFLLHLCFIFVEIGINLDKFSFKFDKFDIISLNGVFLYLIFLCDSKDSRSFDKYLYSLSIDAGSEISRSMFVFWLFLWLFYLLFAE